MLDKRILGLLGAGAMVFSLAACGSGSSGDNGSGGASPASGASTDTTAAAATIHVVPDATNVGAFNPTTSSVKVGDTVEWKFDDAGNPHTVTSDDGSLFDSGSLNQGQTFKFKFDKAGTYKYHCSLHANMKASITVS
ncbi:MAG: cupredoxin domain-containing protein [Candidatus Dormibacteria bacterium]